MVTLLREFRELFNGHHRCWMMILAVGLLAVCVSTRFGFASDEGQDQGDSNAQSALDGVARTLVKEPEYAASPRYALLVFGEECETKVWMVMDGDALYVDQNANGDLTDDGPPIAQTGVRKLATSHWDCDYDLGRIAPVEGPPHTAFQLSRWNYGDEADKYGLSITVNGQHPMYAGWFGSFWGASPEEASLVHFAGPLELRMLRYKDFVLDSGVRRLSVAFMKRGLGDGSDSRLSIDALPESVVPVVRIDWPVPEGADPLRTSHQLADRCCYWEFYDPNFKVPAAAVAGTATLTISLPAGTMPFALATDRIDVPVRIDEAKE